MHRAPVYRSFIPLFIGFHTSQVVSQISVINSITHLGGGFKDLLFSPRKLGKIPILTNIFQRG